MAKTHNLGFPRIGRRRELKFALEKYWKGAAGAAELTALGATLREQNWHAQASLDFVPVGDFSLYDHVLDMSFLLGNLPERVLSLNGDELDNYFRVARGRAPSDGGACGVAASEMTKWFDTNYHFIVPEVAGTTRFELNTRRLFSEIEEAQALGIAAKPVLIGPITYLYLCKSSDSSDPLALLPRILPLYRTLLAQLHDMGVEWVQMDEPALVTDLSQKWLNALEIAYAALTSPDPQHACPNILIATYFGELRENLGPLCRLPVQGIHIDTLSAPHELELVLEALQPNTILSLGVVSGRNIWKTDLRATLARLLPIHAQLGDRLWIAPTCSLLHVPVDLESEQNLAPEIHSWLAFAVQKLEEIEILGRALNFGTAAVDSALIENSIATHSRTTSKLVRKPQVQAALETLKLGSGSRELGQRVSPYAERAVIQARKLNLPLFPTTTIGSFPQTTEIRQVRNQYRSAAITEHRYVECMQLEIARSVREQENIGLDVFVHGEAERNDMVEYFGEQLEGYAISESGWVQSYGSRCVKPPILYGDISRPKPMTVKWIRYAQSLTSKPMKGMLTGPVTILNWSFVRDDQPREQSCLQLALAIRDEVLDLESAGISLIQIDEAALREGLPLRADQWASYLDWAVRSFRITANGVHDETQIHTHMCYSEFNDIIDAIAALDADVITIETSRSKMELLNAFDDFAYPNQIGPGVYDIHSPNIPTQDEIVSLMKAAELRIPRERLWINPDCGLKTRAWSEVIPALQNLVAAAKTLRALSV